MRNVSEILRAKGSKVQTVGPNTSVIDALQLMAAHNMGSVVVVNASTYMGIVTERDYSRKVILKGKNSTDTLVSEIMSTDLPHLSPLDTIDICMELMSERRIRYLPVFDAGRLCGIISMSDVVNAVISNQLNTISHLEHYISGTK